MRISEVQGFVDIDIPIETVDATDDGVEITARGQWDGRAVGFRARIESSWDPKPIDGTSDFFYWGWIVLESLGPDSSTLVAMLSSAYGCSLALGPVRDEIRVRAVGLASDPTRVLEAPIHTKLFFEHDDDDRYAEVFLSFDVAASSVGLHEKDSDYRRPLLLALTNEDAG